uniref:Uncharacterized protein n=1 Tax=Ditylenchus dipsaci TaxID=166011 RepID=A0A915ECY4_9BILA
MMRLSSTRRFKWESTLKFLVAGVSYLIGWNSNGDSLSGCVGLICDSCSLLGNGSWTVVFLGSVHAFSSSFFAGNVCYRLHVLDCGTCRNGFKSSCHHGLLGSAHVFSLYSLERGNPLRPLPSLLQYKEL